MAEIEILVAGAHHSRRRLEGAGLTLGRSPESDLAFPADAVLSRRHLILEPCLEGWQVRDLGSKNGTQLNGKRLEGHRRLQTGDRVEAGGVTIVFHDGVPPPEPADRTVIFIPGALETRDKPASVQMQLQQAIQSGFQAVPAGVIKPGTGLRWRALIEAGRELAGQASTEDLFPRILDLTLEAVEAERGVLLTCEAGHLKVRAARGEGFRISSTVRDRVLEKRESLLIVDVRGDDALRESRTLMEAGVLSLMAVPLQTDEKVIGLLYVDAMSFVRTFSEDDLALATVLANIAAIRLDHARLVEVEQAERVVQNELRQAAEIQQGLLPKTAPELEDTDLAGLSIACRSVAGDFFDYRPLPDGRWLILIGDVTGKGLSAALLAAGLQARVHVLAEDGVEPDKLLARLNSGVCGVWPPNRFVTLFALALDPATGEFSYSNGGHNPPLLVRAAGGVERLSEGGLPVGMIKGMPYSSGRDRLDPGDTLLLYTDGSVEAESPSGQEYGEERLAEVVRQGGDRPLASLLAAICDEVTAHLEGAPAADDLTLVGLRRR
jgi:serine phosphatase RsbU (regulator of sigma subunit)/pSer/pThr/pTyr-binding forkhead associated (FHA) protein